MSHWTEDLFVNHPELFVKALEERVSIARDEVDLFLKYLGEEGFKPRRILDLNCGSGRHSIELGKRGIARALWEKQILGNVEDSNALEEDLERTST
jgi:ribosomal protein L11 methylase PrmA